MLVVEDTDEALVKYSRERDVASLELCEFARETGEPGYNDALNRAVFAQLRDHAELRDRILAVQERRISPFAAFTMKQVVGWVARELLRGRFGVVRPFLAKRPSDDTRRNARPDLLKNPSSCRAAR